MCKNQIFPFAFRNIEVHREIYILGTVRFPMNLMRGVLAAAASRRTDVARIFVHTTGTENVGGIYSGLCLGSDPFLFLSQQGKSEQYRGRQAVTIMSIMSKRDE